LYKPWYTLPNEPSPRHSPRWTVFSSISSEQSMWSLKTIDWSSVWMFWSLERYSLMSSPISSDFRYESIIYEVFSALDDDVLIEWCALVGFRKATGLKDSFCLQDSLVGLKDRFWNLFFCFFLTELICLIGTNSRTNYGIANLDGDFSLPLSSTDSSSFGWVLDLTLDDVADPELLKVTFWSTTILGRLLGEVWSIVLSWALGGLTGDTIWEAVFCLSAVEWPIIRRLKGRFLFMFLCSMFYLYCCFSCLISVRRAAF